MERGFEQLIVMAAIVLAGVLDLLVRWVRGKQRRKEQGKAEPEPGEPGYGAHPRADAGDEVPFELLDEEEIVVPEEAAIERSLPATPPPPAAPVPVVFQRPPPSPPIRPRRVARRMLTHPLDARRGIVMMTILGPCRGLQRPDSEA